MRGRYTLCDMVPWLERRNLFGYVRSVVSDEVKVGFC
jgi:hypothetical protein